MNDELANDRTYLAWLRTGIACVALGFVVAKSALIIKAGGKPVSNKGIYGITGVLIVLSGAALVIAGYLQHREVARHLQTDATQQPHRWPLATTAVAVTAALLLAAPIAVST
jgi:putative membrane protein